uniref:Uncharacterized protein n=1 Tax=Schizaphis graminum TaxID=13262 RepID=A0A2S2NDV4_SCHGA
MYKTLIYICTTKKGPFYPQFSFILAAYFSSGVTHARSIVSFSPGCGSYTCSVRIHNGKILCVIIIQTAAVTPSAGWTLADPFLCFLLKAGRPLLSPAAAAAAAAARELCCWSPSVGSSFLLLAASASWCFPVFFDGLRSTSLAGAV